MDVEPSVNYTEQSPDLGLLSCASAGAFAVSMDREG